MDLIMNQDIAHRVRLYYIMVRNTFNIYKYNPNKKRMFFNHIFNLNHQLYTFSTKSYLFSLLYNSLYFFIIYQIILFKFDIYHIFGVLGFPRCFECSGSKSICLLKYYQW